MSTKPFQSPNHDEDGKFCKGNLAGIGRKSGVRRPKGIRKDWMPRDSWGELPQSYSLLATAGGSAVAVCVRLGRRSNVVGEFASIENLRWMVRELRAAGIRRK